jgi:hypothetical protein
MEYKDLIFVTTTIHSKWLNYQQKILKKNFPSAKFVVVDGRSGWPNSWFYWIQPTQKQEGKYFIHIDEDFFLTSKEELLRSIQWMEDNNLDVIGCSDGYHHYRGANPMAINTFLMIGKKEFLDKIVDLNLDKLTYQLGSPDRINYYWFNNGNIKFNPEWKVDFKYPHKIQGGENWVNEQEPYYAFLWSLKNAGAKFGYLYPHFDEYYKSTNPRLDENSPDIGIHMWYTRNWSSNMDVHGLPNSERYNRIEKYLIKNV